MTQKTALFKNVFLLQFVESGFWAHPGSYSMDTGVLSAWVKRPRRETEQVVARSR
jgi:hypothetical protein